MLKKLKKQLQEEEEALAVVKKYFKHLRTLKEEEILSYLNLAS